MRTTICPASETPWERAKMEQIVRADIAAFGSGRAEMANAMIEQSGIRVRPDRNRGRSAGINPTGRFEPVTRHVFDDGWETLEDLPPFKHDGDRVAAVGHGGKHVDLTERARHAHASGRATTPTAGTPPGSAISGAPTAKPCSASTAPTSVANAAGSRRPLQPGSWLKR